MANGWTLDPAPTSKPGAGWTLEPVETEEERRIREKAEQDAKALVGTLTGGAPATSSRLVADTVSGKSAGRQTSDNLELDRPRTALEQQARDKQRTRAEKDEAALRPKYQSVGKALMAGFNDLGSLTSAGFEAVGEITGWQGLADAGTYGREKYQEQADAYGPRGKFTDINSVGDALRWAGQTGGNMVPVMLPMAVGGAAGGLAFGTVGGFAGAFVPGVITSVGETQQNAKDKDPNNQADGWIFAGGTAIAALDSVLPGKIGASLAKRFGTEVAEEIAIRALVRPISATSLAKIGKEAGKDAVIEGITESVQEAIGEVAAAKSTEQGIDWKNLPDAMVESAAAGALMGGVTGGVHGASEARADARASRDFVAGRQDRALNRETTLPPPPLTPDDIASPFGNSVIQRGKTLMEEKLGERPAGATMGVDTTPLDQPAETTGTGWYLDEPVTPKAEEAAPMPKAQRPKPVPASDGAAAARELFPEARITSGYRGPDHPLSKANPNSWHTKSHAAVDMAPVKGMTFEQAKKRFTDAGFTLIEALDETGKGRTAHATGDHWHFVLGKAEGAAISTDPAAPSETPGIDWTSIETTSDRVARDTETAEDRMKSVLGEDVTEPRQGERVEVTQNGETIPGTVQEVWEQGGRKGVRVALENGTTFDEALEDARDFGARITRPVEREEARPAAPTAQAPVADAPKVGLTDAPSAKGPQGTPGRDFAAGEAEGPSAAKTAAQAEAPAPDNQAPASTGFVAKGPGYEAEIPAALSEQDAKRIAAEDSGLSPWQIKVERAEQAPINERGNQDDAASPAAQDSAPSVKVERGPVGDGDVTPAAERAPARIEEGSSGKSIVIVGADRYEMFAISQAVPNARPGPPRKSDGGVAFSKKHEAAIREALADRARIAEIERKATAYEQSSKTPATQQEDTSKTRDEIDGEIADTERRAREDALAGRPKRFEADYPEQYGAAYDEAKKQREVAANAGLPSPWQETEDGEAPKPQAAKSGGERLKERIKDTNAAKGAERKMQDWRGKDVPNYEEQGLRGDYDGGPTKDAFLKDAKDYLNAVAAVLAKDGFEGRPGKPKTRGKDAGKPARPEQPVRVSESGPASSGDVFLEMYPEGTGPGIMLQVTISSMSGPQGGASIIARRMTRRDGRNVQGDNNWWPADLTAQEMADRAKKLIGFDAAPRVESTAPEHATVGVDDRELSEIVTEFNDAQAAMVEGGEKVTHIFDAPAKNEIVRLENKAKVYREGKGWMTPAEAAAEIANWKAHAAEQGKTRENADKIVLSLFDLSGEWSKPWEEAGYQVYRFDIQADPDVGDINNFSTEFFSDWFGDFDGQDIYAILAACPCTDFASSGARHFAAKDADGRTVASVKLVHQTLAAIEYFKPAVWSLENPVGRIEKLGGLPPWRLSFDPNHIGEPYTKKTLLWGRFNADLPIAPVEPTEGSKMWSQYGGKSLATKNARSVTPEGFAYSFFMANNAVDHPAMAVANKFDRLDRKLIERAIEAGVTPDAITDAVEDLYYQELDDEGANAAIRDLIPGGTPTNDDLLQAAKDSGRLEIIDTRKPASQAITLKRMGDFYEAFDGDAKVLANALNIAVAQRGGKPMSGIPAWSLEQRRAELAEAGITLKVEGEAVEAGPAPASDYGANNRLVTQDRAAELRARLKEKLNPGRLNSGIDPELLAIGTELAVFHIEAGARRFVDLARAIARDLDMPVAAVRKNLRGWYNGARDFMEDSGESVAGMDTADEVGRAMRTFEEWATQETTDAELPNRVPASDEPAGPSDVQGTAQPAGRDERAPGREGSRGTGDVPAADAGRADASERSAGEPGSGAARDGDRVRNADRVPERAPRDGERVAADAVTGTDWSIAPGALDEGRSPAQKARDNVEAVELVKRLKAEGRPATKAEQAQIAKYVGWGGLKNIFPDAQGRYGKGFEELGPRLKAALTPEEYETANRSIQWAHYTGETVVRAMWQMAERLGFRGGMVFEPGMGTGNFRGMMPGEIAAASRYSGIEYDHLTADIAKLLYPQSGVRQDDYTRMPRMVDAVDLVIGNPPFAETAIKSDKDYGKYGFLIHDFFFAKSIDAVKPGGLLLFVTSAGTMNKANAKAREYLADRADLVGAIRLPGNAFEKNAGTSVTTDIVILRKRLPGEAARDTRWTETRNTELPARDGGKHTGSVSSYFLDNPEMVLGEQGFFDQLVAGVRYAVRAPAGFDLEAALAKAIERLPVGVMGNAPSETTIPGFRGDDIDLGSGERKDGSYYVAPDGRLMQYQSGVGQPVKAPGKGVTGGISAKAQEKIRGLIPIRDALREVYSADLKNDVEKGNVARAALNKAYDAFVKKHGPINKTDVTYRAPSRVQIESARAAAREEARLAGREWDDGSFNIEPFLVPEAKASLAEIARERAAAREAAIAAGKEWDEGSFDPEDVPETVIEKRPNLDPFMLDEEAYRLSAIEHYNRDTGEAAKGRAFYENAVRLDSKPEINSPQDALLFSLNQRGHPDIDLISQMAGKSREEVLDDLGGALFAVPGEAGRYETAEMYLSGNVRAKLATAEEAAQRDPALQRNVDALKAVQPSLLGPGDIAANLGMPWLPPATVQDFMVSHLGLGRASVSYNRKIATWAVQGDTTSAASTSTWGTSRRDAIDLMKAALNREQVQVYDTIKTPEGDRRVLNQADTQAAQDKLAEIQQAFRDWIWQDETRTGELVDFYNREYNNLVAPKFSGDYLTTPGISSGWAWRPHQRSVVSRIIQAGNTYMAHEVGAGKTSAMIGAGMEMKRLGLVKKPMYVVPNHMLAQFTKEFYEQYPLARIKVADEDYGFHTARRKRFIAQMAAEDLDAVIIKHSSFQFLPMSQDFTDGLIQDQIAELEDTLREVDKGERVTRRQIEQQKQALEQRLLGKGKKNTDNVFSFEETGIDFLFVDEAHLFRKLDFTTRMGQVKGVDPNGSQASFDLYSKVLYLEQQRPGRSVVLASGTPITNTMAELYSVSRYLQMPELRARGLENFDAWAGAFGETVTALEQDPAGGYKPQTRFAKFVNVPELSVMVRQVMDVVGSDQLRQYVSLPTLKGGERNMILADQTDRQAEYQEVLKRRMEAIQKRSGPPQKGDDILLSVIGDGRKNAIDHRLIDPSAPREPGSKLELLIERVFETNEASKRQPLHQPLPEGKGYSEQPVDYGPGTQMIFADLGINGAFPVHKYIKQQLIARGMPEKQVAIISDYKTNVAKQRLFNDMNEGKVRVLIGSVPKMGTGVNAQRRIVAIHNLDAQWFPANDIQRNGRGIRQGNMNPEIEIADYSTQGTYDSTMWGLMAKKARFIEGFMRGDPDLRDMEDLGEASQYEQAQALTTSDPRIMELTEWKQELEKIERREAAHRRGQQDIRIRIADAKSALERATARIPQIEEDIAQREPLPEGDWKATFEGKTYESRAEFGEHLLSLIEAAVARFGNRGTETLGKYRGFTLRAEVTPGWGKDGKGLGRLVIARAGSMEQVLDATESAVGITQRVDNALANLEGEIERHQERIAAAEKVVSDFTPRLGEVFDDGGRAAELSGQINALEETLARESAEKGKPREQVADDFSAGWTDKRIDSLLEEHSYLEPDRTKAYVGWLSPEEFGKLTTPVNDRPAFGPRDINERDIAYRSDRLTKTKGSRKVNGVSLNLDKMSAESQTPFLIVEEQAGGSRWRIIGHEGRHRMAALAKAGVKRVPIVFKTRQAADRAPVEAVRLMGQDYAAGTLLRETVLQRAIPISTSNRAAIKAEFGQADIRFREGESWADALAGRDEEVRAELQRQLDAFGISDRITLEAGRNLSLASASSAGQSWNGVISVALNKSRDPAATVAHEAVHAMRDLGLFTKSEWRSLEEAAWADPDVRRWVQRNYAGKGLSVADLREEAAAEHFANHWRDVHRPKGLWSRAFERIARFAAALSHAINTVLGRPVDPAFAARLVQEKIITGEIGARVSGSGESRPAATPVAGFGKKRSSDGSAAALAELDRRFPMDADLYGVSSPVGGARVYSRTAVMREALRQLSRTGEYDAQFDNVLAWDGRAPATFGSVTIDQGTYEDLDAKGMRRFQAAYHGTPHVWEDDRADSSKIGTGEGAQAYGYGLYFASKKGVAEHYRTMLSRGQPYIVRWNGESWQEVKDRFNTFSKDAPWSGDKWDALMGLDAVEVEGSVDAAIATRRKIIERLGDRDGTHASTIAWLEAHRDEITVDKRGALYTVEIPEDDEYLMWDAPLSEQPQVAKAAFAALGIKDEGGRYPTTGADAYQRLVRKLALEAKAGPAYGGAYNAGQRLASERLHSLGVAGIKYLDGGSRAKGDGSYNFVIFDDARIEVKAREQVADASEGFSRPETEERWNDAKKGIGDGPGFLAKAREGWAGVVAGFSRHWKHLPNEPRFADVAQQFRKLEAAPEAAMDASVRFLRETVASMSKADYDLFSRKVVLDDLAWDAASDRELPFGFTPEELTRERQRFDALVAENATVREALRARKAHNRRVTDEMVRAGVLTRDQVKNPAYFRHMVLDYARAEAKIARTDSKVRSPYWAKRMGSTLDINANFLEAELDWLLKARVDVATADTITWLRNSDHNIRDQLRRTAKERNKAGIDALIAADPELEEDAKFFASRMAIGFKIVGDALASGDVDPIPAHLQEQAEALESGRPGTEPPFGLLAWMLDEKKPGAGGAGMILKYAGMRKQWMREKLGNAYIDPDDIAELVNRLRPDGYTAWQPREGRHFITAKTISESALDMFVGRLADSAAPGIDRDELRSALGTVRQQLVVGPDRYTMVLPTEIADTLTEFGDRHVENIAIRLTAGIQAAWKRWVLINPRRFLKYNINNMSGDLDAVIAGNPGTLSKVKAAWGELRAAANGQASERYTEAMERGVFSSGLSVQEIPDINRLSAMRHLTEDRSKVNQMTIGAVAAVWRALQDSTQFRENLFRLAAYLDYVEKMEAGMPQHEIGYGASVPAMVRAVEDTRDRAALMARDLLGDYGSISTAGGFLRKYIVPFWSWTEINTKRYWRLNKNAWAADPARGAATSTLLTASAVARRAAWLYIRMGMVYGLISLWNGLLFGDDEDDLGENQKKQLHLILGRDSDGEIVTLRLQGALSDVFSTFGFPDAVAALRKWGNDQGTPGAAAVAMAKAPANRVLTSTSPLYSVPLQLIQGQEWWPDFFEPRAIHDKGRFVARTFSVENEYDQVMAKPTRGYARSWEESVLYSRDPGEMAYDTAKGIAYEWLERVKGQEGAAGSSPRGEALRDYRMALRYGDTRAADAALDRYEQFAGTDKGFKQSIARQHPLGPIAKKDRAAFLDSLTDEQLETFEEAEDWYNRVYLRVE